MTGPALTSTCDDCGHIESLHLGGPCSARPFTDDDPLDEARCGCDDFIETYDDDFDDYRLCAGCSDLVTTLFSDDLCDGCVLDGTDVVNGRVVDTLQPLEQYL